MLTMAAPSGTDGIPAAVTDGGGAANVRRASSRRYVRVWPLFRRPAYTEQNRVFCVRPRAWLALLIGARLRIEVFSATFS
jgi:hypothetical protein